MVRCSDGNGFLGKSGISIRYTSFELSIAGCNVLTKCRWCDAGNLMQYFSLMVLKVKKKTEHEMD